MENYTEISQKMYDIAVRLTTIDEAAKVLRETGEFRSLGTILRTFSGSENPKAMLVEGLLPWNPDTGRDSLDKKVRNWLSDKTRAIAKKDVFALARALNLTLDQTDLFMKQITGEGIHWRNPEDILWCYAIVHRLDHGQLCRLQEQVKALGKTAKPSVNPAPGSYTAEVRSKVMPILDQDEAALLDFLAREWENLGSMRNTAFSLFAEYMALLERGFGEEDFESKLRMLERDEKRDMTKDARERQETARREAEAAGRAFDPDADPDGQDLLFRPDKITTRDILEAYLYRKYVPVAERGNTRRAESFSAIQRSIRLNWPDEFAISKMRKRQQDVSRKVLMLLFLATDGGESEYRMPEPEIPEEEDWELDMEPEEELTPDEIFDSLKDRMNLMLGACGFQKLDPRSPFDWMVVFCISSGDLWEADSLLQDMLREMFPETTEE